MGADSPLLPLVGVSIGLLGLIGVLVFAVLKLRRAGREKGSAAAGRLSEEAFAAATIKAAMATRPMALDAPASPAEEQTTMRTARVIPVLSIPTGEIRRLGLQKGAIRKDVPARTVIPT